MENSPDQNLLNRIEIISSAAKECRLDFSNLIQVNADIGIISGFLDVTATQAVFFSCLAELSLQKTVTIDALAKHLKCNVLKLITFISELEVLEKKGLLHKSFRKTGRKHSYNEMGFSVPHFVIEAIRKSDASMLVCSTKFDLPGFLKQISSLIDEKTGNSLTTSQVLAETEFLISVNLHLPFVSFIDQKLSGIVSKCTMFAFSFLRFKSQSVVSVESFANAFFDDIAEQLDFSHQVISGIHELITKDLLQLVPSEFDGEKLVVLSQSAATVLYQDYPALLIADSNNSGLIRSKNLTAKKLFFNETVKEQVKTIEEALKPAMFSTYRKALQRNKLSMGITSIFYGAPGTGKTEAVYQIARKSGRDIMMVDLSQTKSKWFGESERVVKKIFDDYAALLRKSAIEPILFINEADGLFTKRMDLAMGRGNSAEQAINTCQNILLQALENFEGILLATTNLTCNFDKAFERRFTFRIDFLRPDSEVRKYIWKNKLPDLTEDEAGIIGEQFDITGGEIDVQVRQIILKRVMRSKINLFDAVVDCCSRDHGFTGKRKVGFN